MKHTLITIILILPILLAVKAFGQHKNQFKMEQNNRKEHPATEQVAVIDKISIPKKSITAYLEKSLFIRNIIRQQPGFVKYEIFQETGDSGDLRVITIATWKDQRSMDDARVAVRELMQKAAINMPAFLAQHGITMDRGIYQPVEE